MVTFNEAAEKFLSITYGTDCKQKQEAVLSLYRKKHNIKLFVYGTLMKGNSNHERYLAKSKFIGNAKMKDYALYDLGSYPGIVKREGCTVKGEVYEIDDKTKTLIDKLEGEGSLYFAEQVEVLMENDEKFSALVYVYGHDVNESNYISNENQPWQLKRNDMVWYACYGSNMHLDRFKYYIEGGLYTVNNRYYEGCSDKTLPVECKANNNSV